MKNNNNGITTSYPQAHITRSKSKSRGKLKIYNNNNVYLENGEEFEIELFNPTQKTVLAKIEFNGEMISHSGLVLKQGQRIFLERFFDDNKKFKFEVYDIENVQKTRIKADLAMSNAASKNSEITTREKLNDFLEGKELTDNINIINQLKSEAVNFEELEDELTLRANQVEHATRNNGSLKIYFFNEKEIKKNPYVLLKGNWKNSIYDMDNGITSINSSYGTGNIVGNINTTYGNFTNKFSTPPFGTGEMDNNLFSTLGMMDMDMDMSVDNSYKNKLRSKKSIDDNKEESIDVSSFFSQNSLGDVEAQLDDIIGNKVKDTSETGRIGQGSKSSQKFETVDMEFEQYTFHSIEYTILPINDKPIEEMDLRKYCTECGKKLKKTDMYCASCGTKAE